MIDGPRLIERAFPLKAASLDSVHEKNVRHGHISTLHIWPARRPLAACRAALLATLLPDPGTAEGRRRLLEKIGGVVVTKVERKQVGGKAIDVAREETVGGVLHWGREASPDLEWFRREILKAHDGRPPRVLDPFAGGGAIPLEAMRLGCEVTAVDINPVAWFILRCTLEYPRRLAGQHRPLPDFALRSTEFMESFFKGTGRLTRRQLERNLQAVQGNLFPAPDVDLAWHVRAWGWWVLQRAREDLGRFYPTVGGKPTVAYLWARTVACKNCRAAIPLLKTRWLCRKDDKRVLLTLEPDARRTGVVFGVQASVPAASGNTAQRREHDRRLGQGTMSRNGAWCPCCGKPGTVAMEMEDIRQEGLAGRLGTMMTAVVVDGAAGKAYRLPAPDEVELAAEAEKEFGRVFAEIPFGLPDEPLPGKEALGFRVPLYGFDRWSRLFTPRQLLALGTFMRHIRSAAGLMRDNSYPADWVEGVSAHLAMALDRLVDRSSSLCQPDPTPAQSGVQHTFSRFALPMNWDFIEGVTLESASGGFSGALEWVAKVADHASGFGMGSIPRVIQSSAVQGLSGSVDLVVTDPPYYDAIPYSDLMDFFYVWLRRTLHGLSPELDAVFRAPLGPKWDHQASDGELIDDASRHGGDAGRSKAAYEDGMFRAFSACREALAADGRLVVVFAHKHPDAWATLVSAIIRAGFVVDASWPIQTERVARTRSLSSAALSSSVWLVCRKRPEAARPGWDTRVLEEMRANIQARLREYWDAGIRGPDFVWAATGPALEAYSRHPVVKKANEPGAIMEVAEFLRAVRRIVVDFVVGRVLTRDGDAAAAGGLDDVTTYYLLHRHDFGMADAPIGACILYAVSCGLSDSALADQWDLLVRTGGQPDADEEEQAEASGDVPEEPGGDGTGSTVKLRPWSQRLRKSLGYDAEGRPAPLIDQVHRLMHLWKAGDVARVDDYLDSRALRRNALFHRLLQALIELAPAGSDERPLLESLSNHLAARGPTPEAEQGLLLRGDTDS
jgi:adenine-specific DNA methylase